MSNSNKIFKVAVFSAENNQQCLEFRRFSMAREESNLLLLQEKLNNIFATQAYQIFWKDSEGDKISIKTEDDFNNCLEEQNQESLIKLIMVKTNVELDDQELIWIVLLGSVKHHFVVKRSQNFGLILQRYQEFTGNSNLRLKYNGRVLRNEETPSSLSLIHI